MRLITNLLYNLKLPYCEARFVDYCPMPLIVYTPYLPRNLTIWTCIDGTAGCDNDDCLQLVIEAKCD